MDNAPQLPHRPAPPLGTEWNTELRRIQLKIAKNTTMITDGLEMAWESLWKVRGDVGGRVEGKKNGICVTIPGIEPEPLSLGQSSAPPPGGAAAAGTHLLRTAAV